MPIRVDVIQISHQQYLEEKHKNNGGLARFIENVPNQTFQQDEELVSVGFMGLNDVEWFCQSLKDNGLNFNGEFSEDFTIINSIVGNLWNVEWLESDVHHSWFKEACLHTPIV